MHVHEVRGTVFVKGFVKETNENAMPETLSRSVQLWFSKVY